MINFSSRYNIGINNTRQISKKPLYSCRENQGDVFIRKSQNIGSDVPKCSMHDLQYKKELCALSEIPGISPLKLQSIIGPDEFKNVIQENSENRSFYTPGERPTDKAEILDSNKLENVEALVFGGDCHIHTVNSDGSLTVEELLEQAVEYGDKYAKFNGKPFVIGITDHNTVKGCKQAVEIIAKNPDKYKNIRVVLGVEVSAKENDVNGCKLKKPAKYHMLAMCINPFDEKINNFFNYLQEESKSPMYIKPISLQDAYDNIKHQEQCHFALAHPAFPHLGKRIYEDKNVYETLREVIERFKSVTQERALYLEAYYSSYCGDLATDDNMHNTIFKACDELGLYKAGGIDCHSKSIFYRGKSVRQ